MARQLRDCLGHFATGVSVVTCAGGGQPHGATVNAFASVSLDPPLVLVSLGRHTRACAFLAGNPFTVNVLHAHQHDLALRFAGHSTGTTVTWTHPHDHLAPRLTDALAYLACTPWRVYDGGDHLLYLGRVEEFGYTGGEPLLFYRGRFAGIGPETQATPWIGSLDSPEAGWLSPTH